MSKIDRLISDILKIPESDITDEISMRSLDSWEFLTHIESISGIEQAYSVELMREDIVNMTHVATIRRIVTEKGGV